MRSSVPPDSRPLPPGTVLNDRFEIKKFLGAGGFGEVYWAKQLVFRHALRDVALKLFKSDKVNPQNVHEVFGDAITLIGLQEASPSTEVAGHLIQVYDIGILEAPWHRAFLSMKLIPGEKTLQNVIWRWKHGGMPVELSLTFLRQILVPLAWMHTLENPAVHGDIKPDNILLSGDSKLILTDFGLAARLPLGSTGGAIPYQAPESLLGGAAETAADMYAVGLVWYEMLTGHHPFDGVGADAMAEGNDQAYLRAHQQARKRPLRRETRPGIVDDDQRIPHPSEFNEELHQHPQLEAMLTRCLAYKPSERYPNAHLLLAQVDKYLATGEAGPIVSPPPETTKTDHVGLPQKTREMLVHDAEILLESGSHPRARAAAEEALRSDPDFVPALLILARALAAEGQTDQAKASCSRARQLAPDDPKVFYTLADVFEKAGKAGMATAMREQASRLGRNRARKTRR